MTEEGLVPCSGAKKKGSGDTQPQFRDVKVTPPLSQPSHHKVAASFSGAANMLETNSCFLPSNAIPGKAEVSHQILHLAHWLAAVANQYLPSVWVDTPWEGTN